MHECFIIASWMTDIALASLIESGLGRSEIWRGSNGNFRGEMCSQRTTWIAANELGRKDIGTSIGRLEVSLRAEKVRFLDWGEISAD
jgi:hypothetical protein